MTRHLRPMLPLGPRIDRSIDEAEGLDGKRHEGDAFVDRSSTSEESWLAEWLGQNRVLDAAGLIDRYGVEAVLEQLTRHDMIEQGLDGELTISARFRSPGGFLNAALSGKLRASFRPRKGNDSRPLVERLRQAAVQAARDENTARAQLLRRYKEAAS